MSLGWAYCSREEGGLLLLGSSIAAEGLILLGESTVEGWACCCLLLEGILMPTAGRSTVADRGLFLLGGGESLLPIVVGCRGYILMLFLLSLTIFILIT